MTMLEHSQQTDWLQTELESMSSLGGSRVRTSALPESKQGFTEIGRDYGLSSPELLATFDPATQSWRTSQRSLVETAGDGLAEFSETWPRSGMTRNGTAYRLQNLARTITEIGSGLLPTPTTFYTRENWTLEDIRKRQEEVKAATESKGKHHTGNGFGLNLAQAARIWPTPTATDYKGSPTIEATLRRQQESSRGVRLPEQVTRIEGESGALNPTWVEWLQGFPLNWTEVD